ncbi:MAG: nucleoside recognition protein [Christensenellales bacterium]
MLRMLKYGRDRLLNIIWAVMLVLGIAVFLFTGRADEATASALGGAASAVELIITMAGGYALWMGILKIAERSGLVEALSKRVRRIIHYLFSGLSADSPAAGYISLNIIANLLGLGNAATPFGLKAMAAMQKENKTDRATDAMCMFLIINSAAVQLIPSTVITLRNAAGAAQPASITVATLIATMVSASTGIITAKILEKRNAARNIENRYKIKSERKGML